MEGRKPIKRTILGYIPAILLAGLFTASLVIAIVPNMGSRDDRFRQAMYKTDRTIFTTYFYWYRSTGNLENAQQVIYECNPEVVSTITENIQDPPADWPGPTNVSEIISFNATGDGKNYTEAISHHPLGFAPTYNSSGHVISALDQSLPKYSTDQNGIIVNMSSWFDWMNKSWHEWEMRSMMRAGIDVAMPVYWWTGPDSNFGAWAREGLIVLNETITELQAQVAIEQGAGGDYSPDDVPKIAMFYDTTLMRQLWAWNVSQDITSEYHNDYGTAFNEGDGADLTDPYWENQFYLRIQEFYDVIMNGSTTYTVEIEFDGQVDEYCVVWMYGANWFSNVGPNVLDYCKDKFESRYGKKILFVGGGGWTVADVDGECGWGACCGLRKPTGSRIPVGGYGPGYYNIGTLISQDAGYQARNVAKYKEGLQEVIDAGAMWIHIETWNELLEGTDICWTQEFGYQYIDATREMADIFHAKRGAPAFLEQVDITLIFLPIAGFGVLLGVSIILVSKNPKEILD